MIVLVMAGVSWAAIPLAIGFQGQAAGPSIPASGTVIKNITFSVYDAPTGGTKIVDITVPNVPITNRVFFTNIPIPSGTQFNQELWLEISIDGAALPPRHNLASVPYAFHALEAERLTSEVYVKKAGDTMTGLLTLDAGALAGNSIQAKGNTAGGTFETTTGKTGIYGISSAPNTAAVYGENTTGKFPGLNLAAGIGVEGKGNAYGVKGYSESGIGVYGENTISYGVYGSTTRGLAGYFDGNFLVHGNLNISTMAPYVARKLTVGGTIESRANGFKFPDSTVQTSAALGGILDSGGWTTDSSTKTTIMYKVGIGTREPEFKLSLDNDGGILAKGTFGSGTNVFNVVKFPETSHMIWYPRKAAFRAGIAYDQWDEPNIGPYSFGAGSYTKATADSSIALGSSTVASGLYSTAIGSGSMAAGRASTAIGASSSASGYGSTSIGYYSSATNQYSIAFGQQNDSSGLVSTAFGEYNSASGEASTAFGRVALASGRFSTAIGLASVASGLASTALGGSNARGIYSTAIGLGIANGGTSEAIGSSISANGNLSLAAGFSDTINAVAANHEGSFVFSDHIVKPLLSSATNQWTACFSGGIRFYSNSALSSGVSLAAGGSSWSSLSDVNLKENFSTVSPIEVVNKLSVIPVTTWNYKTQPHSIRHMGPTAQDFYAAFSLGEDDKHINTIDADGVALAAIQGLQLMVKDQKKEIENRKQKIQNQAEKINELKLKKQQLEDRIIALEAKVGK